MSSPQTLSGPLADAQIPLLLHKLERLLPYSIPLTRRIQFHLRHPSDTAQVFLAVAGSEQRGESGVQGWLEDDRNSLTDGDGSNSPWLAAHIDLANTGQTQVWLFANWEVPPPSPSSTANDNINSPMHASLMTTLFTHIYHTLVPKQPITPGPDWLELKRTGKYLSIPYVRSKILFGTMNQCLVPFFPRDALTRTDTNYLKYIFPPPPSPSSVAADVNGGEGGKVGLPAGLHFAPMRAEDLQNVLDRTAIPRTLHTLRQLVSVGLYQDQGGEGTVAVGWGFLGKDASLSSLHTEPEHRGRGLAGKISEELLALQTGEFFTPGGAVQETGKKLSRDWSHADVSEANVGSRRVMDKLGGKVMWKVSWVEIDLALVVGGDKEGNQ